MTSISKLITPVPSTNKRGSISTNRQESPTNSLKTYNGTSMGPLFDWAYSSVMEDVLNKKNQFNR